MSVTTTPMMRGARRHASVVHAEELEEDKDKDKGKEVQDIASPGGAYRARRWRLGAAAGSSALGCSLYEVPAGAAAFPAHYHAANEEALYVLDGEGVLRIGQEEEEEEVRVKAGDYVALPVGPKQAHKLINPGPNPLRYLAVSTMNPTDVVVYPDSGKVGVLAGGAPGNPAAGDKRYVAGFVHLDKLRTDYYAGEE